MKNVAILKHNHYSVFTYNDKHYAKINGIDIVFQEKKTEIGE